MVILDVLTALTLSAGAVERLHHVYFEVTAPSANHVGRGAVSRGFADLAASLDDHVPDVTASPFIERKGIQPGLSPATRLFLRRDWLLPEPTARSVPLEVIALSPIGGDGELRLTPERFRFDERRGRWRLDDRASAEIKAGRWDGGVRVTFVPLDRRERAGVTTLSEREFKGLIRRLRPPLFTRVIATCARGLGRR